MDNMDNLAERERKAKEAKRRAQEEKKKRSRERRESVASGFGAFFCAIGRGIAFVFCGIGRAFAALFGAIGDNVEGFFYWLLTGLSLLVSAACIFLQILGIFVFYDWIALAVQIAFYVSLGAIVTSIISAVASSDNYMQYIPMMVIHIIMALALAAVAITTLSMGMMSVKGYKTEGNVVYIEYKTGYEVRAIDKNATEVTVLASLNGKNVKGVKNCAAMNNMSLRAVTFAGDIKDFNVGQDAFKGCENLETVRFADGVHYVMGTGAFMNCPRLALADMGHDSSYFTYKDCFATGGNTLFEFNNCTVTTEIYSAFSNTVTISVDGATFNTRSGVRTVMFKSNSQYFCGDKGESHPVNSEWVFMDGFDFNSGYAAENYLDKGVFSVKKVFYALADKIYIPASVTSLPKYLFGDKGNADVYFAGTEEQWNALAKETEGNANLSEGRIKLHFNQAYVK